MKVNLNLGRLALMLAATVMGLAISASVNAQTVLIDLGNDQGYRSVDVPNPDVNGNYWNSVWSGAITQILPISMATRLELPLVSVQRLEMIAIMARPELLM